MALFSALESLALRFGFKFGGNKEKVATASTLGSGSSASASDGGQAASTGDNSSVTQIREQHIHAAPPDPQTGLAWRDHTDAPVFHMSPGIDPLPDQSGFKLLMGFYMERGRAGRPSVRWVGAGIDPAVEWTLMEDNRRPGETRNKYSVKGPPVIPATDSEDYEFEVTFRWIDGAIHGCAWKWTVGRRDDRRWNMNNDAANTAEPYRCW